MPELPEVHTIVTDLAPQLEGRTFQQVLINWPGSVEEPSPDELAQGLAGQRIEHLSRRGKYLLFDLVSGYDASGYRTINCVVSSKTLIVHLGMTGRLYIPQPGEPPDPYCVARFLLDAGVELRFADVRKFGRIWLVDEAARVVGKLGPEALDESFGPGDLVGRLNRRPGARIKALLLDQSFLAGLGNIYTDEALYEARIHPASPAGSLPEGKVKELYRAIREVLHRGIRNRGTTFSDYRDGFGRLGTNQDALAVFRRTGEPCPRCSATIQRTVVAGRGTYFCPCCQEP